MFPIMPYIISLAGAIIISKFLGINNNISSIVISYIKVKNEWKNVIIILIMIISLIVINIAADYFIINGFILSIINGIITGMGLSLVNLNKKSKEDHF